MQKFPLRNVESSDQLLKSPVPESMQNFEESLKKCAGMDVRDACLEESLDKTISCLFDVD